MFRRYHHGHSLALGVLVGLLLTEHPWTLACLAFSAGALLMWIALSGRRMIQTLIGAFELWRDHARAKRQEIHSSPQPVYTGKFPKGY